MIKRLKRIFGFGTGQDVAEAINLDWPEIDPKTDPYKPGVAHAEILEATRFAASADAIRHAEGLLGRSFPIVGEAAQTFEVRMAALRQEFGRRSSELEARLNLSREHASIVDARVAALDAAIGSHGTSDEGNPEDGAAGSGITSSLSSVFSRRSPIERLRRAREDEGEELLGRRREVVVTQARLNALPGQTRDVAELEVAFARQVVSTYTSTVFSSMPAGALDGEGQFIEQPQPAVSVPDWVPSAPVEGEKS